jgi:hypothetical protein
MNIFFLSLIPKECAKLYCDQHVIKILLEIVQMMYTAWHHSGVENWTEKAPLTKAGSRGYKKAHSNHPMTRWIRAARGNYVFAAKLGCHLANEYTRRFKKIHACTSHIVWLHDHIPPFHRIIKSPSTFYSSIGIPECMPQEFWDPDIVIAYKNYYKSKKFVMRFREPEPEKHTSS